MLTLRARAVQAHTTGITRVRLDAALSDPAPPRTPQQTARPRVNGRRQPPRAQRLAEPTTLGEALTVPRWYGRGARVSAMATGTALWDHRGRPPLAIRWVLIRDPQQTFAPQALLCTDPDVAAPQIVSWFVWRWPLALTFQEVCAHLGVETQRHWADLAILRTTPAVLGLFSFVTLLAHDLTASASVPLPQAAWYPKTTPTFADAIALVRRHLWFQTTFCLSPLPPEMQQVPRALVDRLAALLCYAA